MTTHSRRDAIKMILGASALTLAPRALGAEPEAAAAASAPSGKRPNFLVIMSDDQGAGDVGFVGNEWARTPVLDALAAESAEFTNFVAAPACTPSRASYLTGRNFAHTGVWGVGPRGYIRRDETFLPEYLHRAGYRTAHFGKWGEGWTPDQRTYMRGYDEALALGGGYQHKDTWADENGTLVQKEGWTIDVLADRTIAFMREQAETGQPWYAITAYIAPHSPWECNPEYSEPLEAEGYSKPLAAFYGMVRHMDDATGRILAELERLGMAQDTVVIFISDNGATENCELTGGTPMDGEDWARRNALNLRMQKSYVWENGIHVPCLIRWPDRIPAGRREHLGSYEDILPTILDLAGVPDSVVPDHLPLHGTSLKTALLDPDAPEEARYYWRYAISFEGSPPAYPQLIIEDPKLIRYDQMHTTLFGPRFKYHSLPGGGEALYDMDVDISETNDVSAQHPDVTQKMARLCRAEWDKLIESGRGFWMPPILIGDPRYAGMKRCWAHLPPNIVPCNTAQRVRGTVTCPFQGLLGFTTPEDSAAFALDVRTADRYEVTMTGDKLSQCAPLTLDIGGRKLTPRKVTDKEIAFGTVDLPVGAMDLVVAAAGEGAESGYIKEIAILPVADASG